MSLELGIIHDQPMFENTYYQNSAVSLLALHGALLPEVKKLILNDLKPADSARCQVSHEWQRLSQEAMLQRPLQAFGQKEWFKLGVYVDEPLLPSHISEILDKQCPFSEEGVKIKDSHLLILLPGNLKGDPVGFRNLGKLIEQQFPELGEEGYTYLKRHAETTDGIRSSRWVLMKKSGFAKSLSIEEQKKSVEETGGKDYKIGRAVDILACAIAEYARSKINILKTDVIRGLESENGRNIVMGGKKGFFVSNCDWGDLDVSVLPMKELESRV